MKNDVLAHTPEDQPQERRYRSRPGPVSITIWFVLIGIQWLVLVWWVMLTFETGPLTGFGYALWTVALMLAVFYFWVAYAVYHRRRYVFDAAVVCAGLGLLAFPLGTLVSIFLLSSLMTNKHRFSK